MVQAECTESGKAKSMAFDIFNSVSMEFDKSNLRINVKKQIGMEVPNVSVYICLGRVKIQGLTNDCIDRHANRSTIGSQHSVFVCYYDATQVLNLDSGLFSCVGSAKRDSPVTKRLPDVT